MKQESLFLQTFTLICPSSYRGNIVTGSGLAPQIAKESYALHTEMLKQSERRQLNFF